MKIEDSKAFFHGLVHSKHPLRLCKASTEAGSMGQMGESITVGCKVLPVCQAGICSDGADSKGSFGRDGAKCDWRAAMLARMKMLLKSAAAAKANKVAGIKGLKVLYFRNRMTIRDPLDDSSSTSSRISLKWDVGSCSASSSVFSPMAMASKNLPDVPECDGSNASSTPESEEYCIRTAHWVTTDSDFVVLEL